MKSIESGSHGYEGLSNKENLLDKKDLLELRKFCEDMQKELNINESDKSNSNSDNALQSSQMKSIESGSHGYEGLSNNGEFKNNSSSNNNSNNSNLQYSQEELDSIKDLLEREGLLEIESSEKKL